MGIYSDEHIRQSAGRNRRLKSAAILHIIIVTSIDSVVAGEFPGA